MSVSRRDFMKMFGVGLASLLLTRCRGVAPIASCYLPALPPPVFTPPPPASADARTRVRLGWLRFSELAQKTGNGQNQGNDSWDDPLGQQMISEQRAALDELVASGDVPASVANLVQEAYAAAVYHIWRSNVPITCYEPVILDYAPAGAETLLRQSEILTQEATQGTIDPDTLSKAQASLEHDLAYYALSDADRQTLYDHLLREFQDQGQPIPSFDSLQLEIPPDAKAAAEFVLDILAGK